MSYRSRHSGFIVVLLIASAVVSACAVAPDGQQTPRANAIEPAGQVSPPLNATPPAREIVIGAATDLTGPFASSGVPRSAGQTAYVRYVNEKLGGINGVRVKLVTVDTGYDMNREVSLYKRFRDTEKALMMFHISSGAATAIAPMAEEDGMLQSHSAEPSATFRGADGWFFPGLPMWMDGGGAAFRWWYATQWQRRNPDREPNVALVNMDAVPGRTNARYFREVLKQMNIPIVVDLATKQTISDATGLVAAMKDNRADILVGLQSDVTWTVIVRDMKRLGVNIPKIAPYFGPLSSDVMKSMGDAGTGLMSFIPYATWDDDNVEGIRLIRSLYNEWTPGIEEHRHQFYWGWEETAIAVAGISKALARVGYDGLTKDLRKGRLALRDAMYEVKGFDAKGVIPPVEYSKDDRRPFKKVKVARIGAGAKIETITDWIEAPALSPEMRNARWWEQ